jgi:glutamate N-acetyltransferase/amino-acid N-acetyltransferase
VADKKDIALFYSSRPAAAAGLFTSNRVKAAPVRLSQRHLQISSLFRGVLINSGCANACTGPQGEEDALWSLQRLAKGLHLPAKQFLVASTGVIGRHLPRPALERGLKNLVRAVEKVQFSAADAVAAIMTTDTRPKAAGAQFSWDGKRFTLWGCVKGAGMIHPNMATLLSVVLTDIRLPPVELRAALKWSADRSLNRVSVDGDTSTNDSLFLLANGSMASYKKVSPRLRTLFRSALLQVGLSLSAQIAADGEGATRTAWIFVENAVSEKAAARLAAAVATSPLVKTALHGADPNWGRVLAALGRAGVEFDPNRVDVRFGDMVVCRGGQRADYSEQTLHNVLKRDKVVIAVDLHQGKRWSHYVTCDFSKEYVSINADYTT